MTDYRADLRKILSDAGFLNISAIVDGKMKRPEPPDAAMVGDMTVVVTYDVMHHEDALHVSIAHGTDSSRSALLDAFATEIGRMPDSRQKTHYTIPVEHGYWTIREKANG